MAKEPKKRKSKAYTRAEKMLAVQALEKNGRIDPDDLIEAARDPKHPCHDDFTWDISAAARERWREQARELIREVKFSVEVVDVGQREVTYYVSEQNEGESPTFRSLPAIRSVRTMEPILNTELRQLLGCASRVLGIAEAKTGILGSEPAKVMRSVCGMIRGLLEQ